MKGALNIKGNFNNVAIIFGTGLFLGHLNGRLGDIAEVAIKLLHSLGNVLSGGLGNVDVLPSDD